MESSGYVSTQDLWTKPSNVNTCTSPLPKKSSRKCQGDVFFSKLDTTSGYCQIKVVDELSSNLLAFGTSSDRYRFKRLPYGIHSAIEVFQQREDTSIISYVPARANSQIRKQSIVFLGHIILSEGIKIDPSKTDAITKMPLPRSVNELQRFLGMVN